MKKLLFAVLIAFSFCLINSNDTLARKVETSTMDHKPGMVTKTTITKKNGPIKEIYKSYDEDGKLRLKTKYKNGKVK